MKIHWAAFLVSVILLWPPVPLTPPELRRMLMNPRRQDQLRLWNLLGLWQNWVDLIRAVAGTFILVHIAVTINPDGENGAIKTAIVYGAVLAIGVVSQCIRSDREVHLFAPIPYLIGLTLVLSNYDQGGFAIFVGTLLGLSAKKPSVFLPSMLLALAMSALIIDRSLPILVNCALIALPLFLGIIVPQRLYFAGRLRVEA